MSAHGRTQSDTKTLLIAAILFVLTTTNAEAQPTVQQYRDFPASGRTGYVVGWYGGFMYAFLNFIAPEEDDSWTWHVLFGAEAVGVDVKVCMEGSTFGQAQDVFDAYIEVHTDVWQEHARVHLGLSLIEACLWAATHASSDEATGQGGRFPAPPASSPPSSSLMTWSEPSPSALM